MRPVLSLEGTEAKQKGPEAVALSLGNSRKVLVKKTFIGLTTTGLIFIDVADISAVRRRLLLAEIPTISISTGPNQH